MNRIELGRRLREARELRGISQQAAGVTVGVPRTAVTQIEAGNRGVSTLELSKLAELYRVPVARFFEDRDFEPEEDLLIALHRGVRGLEDHPDVQAEVERCVEVFREGVQLERLLGSGERPSPPSYDAGVPRTIGEAIRDGERTAHNERQRLGLGNSPIPDVSELLVSQGIWASALELPNQMSGVFLQHNTIGLAILVNARHVRARKRFSYAHEFAHALMDRDARVQVSSADNAADLVEKRANAFAAAFLMPRAGMAIILMQLDKGRPSRSEQSIFDVANDSAFDAEIRPVARSQNITFSDVALIAHHFGVSYQAAVYRLKSLRHISAAQSGELLDNEQYGREYLRALDLFEDLEVPENNRRRWNRELRAEVAHLGIEAYRQGEISRGRLLEVGKSIDFEGDELLVLAEAACG